jgi:hypothetical protein
LTVFPFFPIFPFWFWNRKAKAIHFYFQPLVDDLSPHRSINSFLFLVLVEQYHCLQSGSHLAPKSWAFHLSA